jgi:hypothetical protein
VVFWSGSNCMENDLRVWFSVLSYLSSGHDGGLYWRTVTYVVLLWRMGQQYIIDRVVSITIDVVEMHIRFGIGVDMKLFQHIQE